MLFNRVFLAGLKGGEERFATMRVRVCTISPASPYSSRLAAILGLNDDYETSGEDRVENRVEILALCGSAAHGSFEWALPRQAPWKEINPGRRKIT